MNGDLTIGEDVVRRSATRVLQCLSTLPTDLQNALFHEPDALLASAEVLRANGARRTALMQWGARRFVLKHYVEPSWRHAVKQSVHRSRARACWLTSQRLANAGVATPRPVAFVENRWGLLRRDSYLVYPYVEGETLRSYFSGEQESGGPFIENLWKQLGQLWDRLKQLRVSLSDANLGNFIVGPASRLWVIDVDNTRFHSFEFAARRHQLRGWRQVLRSAARCAGEKSHASLSGVA